MNKLRKLIWEWNKQVNFFVYQEKIFLYYLNFILPVYRWTLTLIYPIKCKILVNFTRYFFVGENSFFSRCIERFLFQSTTHTPKNIELNDKTFWPVFVICEAIRRAHLPADNSCVLILQAPGRLRLFFSTASTCSTHKNTLTTNILYFAQIYLVWKAENLTYPPIHPLHFYIL